MFIIIITSSISFIIIFYGSYYLYKKFKKRISKIHEEGMPVSLKTGCKWLKQNSFKKNKLHTIFETKEEHEISNQENRKPSIII
jgi:hypothetical protein